MEYHEAANVLFDLRQFRPKPGTDSTRDLLEQLGSPENDIDFIQIAGSNGKGSTARMTAAILGAAGYSVGLYTSPHFDDVRERFRVDGRMIPKSRVTTFVEEVRPYLTERAATGDPVTFFEATTAMAIWYFALEEVDIGVLEVGIGGQFDATCVVDPVASAVTTVSLEHTEILGETIEEIAHDKAHVAPRAAPLITGARGEALAAVEARCHELHEERMTGLAPEERLVRVGSTDAEVIATYQGRTNHVESEVSLKGADWSVTTKIPLLGAYQATNAGIAAMLAKEVADVGESTIAHGLRASYWPGRFEVMGPEPLVILDGAHNPEACTELATVLAEFDFDRLLLVIGAMHEKAHGDMAAALPIPDITFACRPMRDRAEDPAAIANVFERHGCPDVRTVPSVETAVERAIANATSNDCVLVTGSLFTVAEARQRWVRTVVPKRVRTGTDAVATLASADVDSETISTSASAGVHRVIKTRVSPRQARWIEEELRARGGMCARTGFDESIEEPVDVVLMATRAQYVDLLRAMTDAPGGLDVLAADLSPLVLDDTTRRPMENLPWSNGPCIMGILNVTPDSFHDGGRYTAETAAIQQATDMVEAGASIIDVGGESTRPGADPVDPALECERILPVINHLADTEAFVSVDTRRASVARAALDAGADMLNDVSGLGDPAMRFVAAEYDVPIALMHSIDTPVVPGRAVTYDDVVEDVLVELRDRVILAEQAGLDRSQIVIDPGLGFGKTAQESFTLLGRIGEFAGLGCPLLVGHSHKSMFDAIGRGPEARGAPTVAGTAIATAAGADIIRVHDVADNVAAMRAVLASLDQ